MKKDNLPPNQPPDRSDASNTLRGETGPEEFMEEDTELETDSELENDPSAEKMDATRVISNVEDSDLTGQATMISGSPPAGSDDTQRIASHLGDFTLIRKLGRGAMATVYKAKQISFNRKVALKILHKHTADTPKLLERFYREARILGQLDHPHIVEGYCVGEAQGFHYFAMEYINGQSLHQWLSKLGKLSVGDAIHVTLACAYALEYAHDLDLIHRDVKPDNVLITRDGVVKLADLGMVKMSDEDMSLTQTGHAVGTPWYMPLEQARNSKDIDARSDIYALGCMFYCMLAGRPPFRGSNIVEVIQAKERGTFPPAKQFNPEVPSRLDLIISKMTAKLPQHRYQNCGEFIDELEELALVNLELEFINNPPVQNSTVDVPPEEKTPYPVKQTMEAPTDLWFLRTRNRQGKVETKRMTTAQVIGLLKSGLIKPESRISRQEHTGFRSLATVREFQHVAFAKVAKSAADRQASKYRQLYKRIEESELVREQEEENEDEVPLSQIILRVAIIGGAILGGVGLIWLIVMLIRVIS